MTVLDDDLWWWPEPGTEYEDEFAEETLRVVQQVAWHAYRTVYADMSLEDVREELQGWLVEYSLTFRGNLDAGKFYINTPILEQWCRVLHATLTKASRWYLAHNRPGGMTGGGVWWLAKNTRSADEPVRQHDGDVGVAVGHYGRPLWVSSEAFDPGERLVVLETVREAIEHLSGEPCDLGWDDALAELDRLAGDPKPGQCGEFGCPYPPLTGKKGSRCYYHSRLEYYENIGTCSEHGCERRIKGRGLCHVHLQREYDAEAPPCVEPDCEKPQQRRGLCSTHYHRKLASGEIQRIRREGDKPGYLRECTVVGCERMQASKGLCNKHYQRSLKGRPIEDQPPPPPPACEVSGCERDAAARGLCQLHYGHAQRGKLAGYEHLMKPCSIEGCSSPRIGRGMCSKHYTRWQRGQPIEDPPSESEAPRE